MTKFYYTYSKRTWSSTDFSILKVKHMTDLEKAWQEFCDAIKQEQPFKFIYEQMIRFLDWLENILEKF